MQNRHGASLVKFTVSVGGQTLSITHNNNGKRKSVLELEGKFNEGRGI